MTDGTRRMLDLAHAMHMVIRDFLMTNHWLMAD